MFLLNKTRARQFVNKKRFLTVLGWKLETARHTSLIGRKDAVNVTNTQQGTFVGLKSGLTGQNQLLCFCVCERERGRRSRVHLEFKHTLTPPPWADTHPGHLHTPTIVLSCHSPWHRLRILPYFWETIGSIPGGSWWSFSVEIGTLCVGVFSEYSGSETHRIIIYCLLSVDHRWTGQIKPRPLLMTTGTGTWTVTVESYKNSFYHLKSL